MNRRKTSNSSDVNDEVEELLRAAEDAALLKLSLNSHGVHASSSDLDPDLDLRFRNLLKPGSRSKAKPEKVTKKVAPVESAKVKEEVEDDDLFARFTALKASIPKPPSTSSALAGTYSSDASIGNVSGDNLVGKDIVEDDEEDEVEKVIKWAMDAARLDPSPASDDDEDIEYKDDASADSEKSDEDADSPKGNQKGQRK